MTTFTPGTKRECAHSYILTKRSQSCWFARCIECAAVIGKISEE